MPLREQQKEGEDLSDEEEDEVEKHQVNGTEVQDESEIEDQTTIDTPAKIEVKPAKSAPYIEPGSLTNTNLSSLSNDHGMTVDLDSDSDSNPDTAADPSKPADEFSGFSPSPSPSPEPTTQNLHEAELLAEAQNLPSTAPSDQIKSILKKSKPSTKAREEIRKKRKAEQEEFERRRGMMSRKKRKVLDRVMVARGREEDAATKLRAKKRKLEKAQEA